MWKGCSGISTKVHKMHVCDPHKTLSLAVCWSRKSCLSVPRRPLQPSCHNITAQRLEFYRKSDYLLFILWVLVTGSWGRGKLPFHLNQKSRWKAYFMNCGDVTVKLISLYVFRYVLAEKTASVLYCVLHPVSQSLGALCTGASLRPLW